MMLAGRWEERYKSVSVFALTFFGLSAATSCREHQDLSSRPAPNIASGWGPWGAWSFGYGAGLRERECVGPLTCPGLPLEWWTCDGPCPAWAAWGAWDECGVGVDKGEDNCFEYRSRTRECIYQQQVVDDGMCGEEGTHREYCDQGVPGRLRTLNVCHLPQEASTASSSTMWP